MQFSRKCPYCNTAFVATYRTAKYCSVSCGRRARTKESDTDVRAYVLARVTIPDDPMACWIWHGSLNDSGYGMAFVRQAKIRASRLAYELFVGPIPQDMHILHDPVICNNRRCINPKHLRCGTNYENSMDRFISETQPQGETHYRTHLTEDDVREIRRLSRDEHMPYERIGARFNIHNATVHNIVHAQSWKHVDADTYVPPSGDARYRLTEDDVRAIRRLRQDGMTLKALAARYGVHLGYVHNICTRKSWRHIP